MFTGIIETTGKILSIEKKDKDSRFIFDTGVMTLEDMNIGDSIAINGTCLSIIEKSEHSFIADLSAETLALTTFSNLKEDSPVNLEKAMRLSDRINGHLVSGHVDGMGKIIGRQDEGRSIRFEIEFPGALKKYISKKGSVTVDGVSLTVNDVNENVFSVNIIPHTLYETIFSAYEVNTEVNLEVDQIARYLEKLINN